MDGKIFNIYQANVFIQKGAEVIGTGISNGNVYIEFETNTIFYKLLALWNCKKFK